METKSRKDKNMTTLVHRATDRGFANHGWLQANHSFSFAGFYNPEKVHFGALRVLNDDIIAPKMGFGTHPHDNMEIITIPLKGVLNHRDSMHNKWQSVTAGEVQVMSAGSGLQHSEVNGSEDEYLNLFQIWIFPDTQNVAPRYDQKMFNESGRNGKLQTLVTSMQDKAETEALKIHQDAKLSRLHLDEGKIFDYTLKSKDHGVYVMNIHGEFSVGDSVLEARDAIGISNADTFQITANQATEILFIEVPMEF